MKTTQILRRDDEYVFCHHKSLRLKTKLHNILFTLAGYVSTLTNIYSTE